MAADWDCSSDADSEVLADYVIALVTDNLPDEELRKRCLENLEDFLGDSMVPRSGASIVV